MVKNGKNLVKNVFLSQISKKIIRPKIRRIQLLMRKCHQKFKFMPSLTSNNAQKFVTITRQLFSTVGDSYDLDASHVFFSYFRSGDFFIKITITMVKMVRIQKSVPLVVCARISGVHTQNFSPLSSKLSEKLMPMYLRGLLLLI